MYDLQIEEKWENSFDFEFQITNSRQKEQTEWESW